MNCELCCNDLIEIDLSLKGIETLLSELKNIDILIEIYTKEVFIMSLANGYFYLQCLECGFFTFIKYPEFEELTQEQIINKLDKKVKDGDIKLYKKKRARKKRFLENHNIFWYCRKGFEMREGKTDNRCNPNNDNECYDCFSGN